MNRPRVYAIGDTNILALRNPIKETQIAFEKRAQALALAAVGLEVGDVELITGDDEYPSPPYEPETQDN